MRIWRKLEWSKMHLCCAGFSRKVGRGRRMESNMGLRLLRRNGMMRSL
ncbi:hypothetical protein M5689_001531 [Euphorbia peplus]|nr:hypothetical protein M5689_001531 [Euphorbia peplus]